MPQLEPHEFLAAVAAIAKDPDKYAKVIKLGEREAAIQAKHAEAQDLAKQAADDRSVAQARRDEAARLNAEKANELAQREQEASTAYSFQVQRDADLKRRELAVKAKADLVQQKEDGFDAREQKLTARKAELDKREADLTARILAYNKRLAAANELAKSDAA